MLGEVILRILDEAYTVIEPAGARWRTLALPPAAQSYPAVPGAALAPPGSLRQAHKAADSFYTAASRAGVWAFIAPHTAPQCPARARAFAALKYYADRMNIWNALIVQPGRAYAAEPCGAGRGREGRTRGAR